MERQIRGRESNFGRPVSTIQEGETVLGRVFQDEYDKGFRDGLRLVKMIPTGIIEDLERETKAGAQDL